MVRARWCANVAPRGFRNCAKPDSVVDRHDAGVSVVDAGEAVSHEARDGALKRSRDYVIDPSLKPTRDADLSFQHATICVSFR